MKHNLIVWWAWGMLVRMIGVALNVLAIAIYAALCIFSAVELAWFRFGPAERVWRSLTYGQAQPMRWRAGMTILL